MLGKLHHRIKSLPHVLLVKVANFDTRNQQHSIHPNGSNVGHSFEILIVPWQVVQVIYIYINSAKVGTTSSGMRWMYYMAWSDWKHLVDCILNHTKVTSLSIPKTNTCSTWTQEGAWQTKSYFPYGGLNPSALKVYLNRIIVNMEK